MYQVRTDGIISNRWFTKKEKRKGGDKSNVDM